MRIVQITTTFGNYSIDKIIRALIAEIDSIGNDCVWAYSRPLLDPKRDSLVTKRIGTKVDTYFHAIKSRLFDMSGFGSKHATKRFLRWLDDYSPNIIHLHSLLGYYINVELLFEYIRIKKVKVIWTQHDCWAFTGHCIHFENAKCEKWKEGCKDCPAYRSYPKSLFVDRSEQNYAIKRKAFTSLDNMIIVSPSKWLDSHISDSFLSVYPHFVIHNGIDLSLFAPIDTEIRKRYAIRDDQVILLGVSSIWTESKGILVFSELANQLDQDNFKIVIVGHLPNKFASISKRIIHIERTSNVNELVEWYSAADIFINPTEADNFPTVNIEALACGTPVITYNTGGSTEIVAESCGHVVNCGDINSLKETIQMYGKRKDFNIVYRCTTHAKEFSQQNMVEQYLELYKTLGDSK